MVVDQLRYSGVFEAVEIRRTGYPFRFTFRQFACRYQCINPHHNYRAKDDKDLCEEILQVSSQDFGDVQLGSSRVLYRAKEHRVLQLLRNLALETIVPRCQKVIRGHLARVMRRRLLKAEKGLAKALKIANDIAMLTKVRTIVLLPFAQCWLFIQLRHRSCTVSFGRSWLI
jgi:myosin heavy subunit